MKENKETQEFQHPSRLISRGELMVLLGVKSDTVMSRMLANKADPIPRIKLPGVHPRFPLDKVLWWIENHVQ